MAFVVDVAAFVVHLLEMMLLDPELQFANQSHLWFARHLALWIQEGGQRPNVDLCEERFP